MAQPSTLLIIAFMVTTAIRRSLQVCEKPQHLGGYYGNHFDSFSSPDYPSPYPANQKCVWMIKVPLDYRIRLQFSAFEVEACSGGGQSCTCDGVVVYDGQLSVSPKLGRFCGHELPNATDSSGRYMRVELVSNSGGLESKGFTATYVSIAPDGSLFSKEDATATPSSTNGSGNKSNSTTIIIAAVCVVAAALLIVLIVFLLIRKRANDRRRQEVRVPAPASSRPAPRAHAPASAPPPYSAAVLAPPNGPPPSYDGKAIA